MRIPTNMDAVINTLDVIEAIKELTEAATEYSYSDYDEWDTHKELKKKLKTLRKLADEVALIIYHWEHGVKLIRDSYFKNYAREVAQGIIGSDDYNEWPYDCIDWEQVANKLWQDYIAVNFDGVIYWVWSG